MKYPLRYRVYAVLVMSLLLALWLRPTPHVPVAVLPTKSRDGMTRTPSADRMNDVVMPVVGKRQGLVPVGLFRVDAYQPPSSVNSVEMPLVHSAAVPDLQLLGWVLSDDIPWVSIMVGSSSYTLRPGDQADELYRYEGVKEGEAVFTYLPDGNGRYYPLSDIKI